MYDFLEWLTEAKASHIRFGAFWKDGRVVVYIGPKRYEYITDAVYHEKWKRLAPYAPGKVLNQIKDMVKRGYAQQVDPEPKQKRDIIGPKGDDSCPNCGTPSPHYQPGLECPGC